MLVEYILVLIDPEINIGEHEAEINQPTNENTPNGYRVFEGVCKGTKVFVADNKLICHGFKRRKFVQPGCALNAGRN